MQWASRPTYRNSPNSPYPDYSAIWWRLCRPSGLCTLLISSLLQQSLFILHPLWCGPRYSWEGCSRIHHCVADKQPYICRTVPDSLLETTIYMSYCARFFAGLFLHLIGSLYFQGMKHSNELWGIREMFVNKLPSLVDSDPRVMMLWTSW